MQAFIYAYICNNDSCQYVRSMHAVLISLQDFPTGDEEEIHIYSSQLGWLDVQLICTEQAALSILIASPSLDMGTIERLCSVSEHFCSGGFLNADTEKLRLAVLHAAADDQSSARLTTMSFLSMQAAAYILKLGSQ